MGIHDLITTNEKHIVDKNMHAHHAFEFFPDKKIFIIINMILQTQLFVLLKTSKMTFNLKNIFWNDIQKDIKGIIFSC